MNKHHYFTFEDLEFQPHECFLAAKESMKPDSDLYKQLEHSKHATLYFSNGYGVSVITGSPAYAEPGKYELCVMCDGHPVGHTAICSDVLANLTEEEVTKAMKDVQDLKG